MTTFASEPPEHLRVLLARQIVIHQLRQDSLSVLLQEQDLRADRVLVAKRGEKTFAPPPALAEAVYECKGGHPYHVAPFEQPMAHVADHARA